MNEKECKSLSVNDRVSHGDQHGVVLINQPARSRLTIKWDNGTITTGQYKKAWMIDRRISNNS